jgi:hypothetical protein
MSSKKIVLRALTGLLCLSALAGCAFVSDFGKLRLQTGTSKEVTAQELLANWRDYLIYYNSIPGSATRALMFDPKNDDKTLANDKWTKIEDEKRLAELSSWIDHHRSSRYVYRILGPKDELFGYMIIPRPNTVLMKRTDDKTLWVYDLMSDDPPPRG